MISKRHYNWVASRLREIESDATLCKDDVVELFDDFFRYWGAYGYSSSTFKKKCYGIYALPLSDDIDVKEAKIEIREEVEG